MSLLVVKDIKCIAKETCPLCTLWLRTILGDFEDLSVREEQPHALFLIDEVGAGVQEAEQ